MLPNPTCQVNQGGKSGEVKYFIRHRVCIAAQLGSDGKFSSEIAIEEIGDCGQQHRREGNYKPIGGDGVLAENAYSQKQKDQWHSHQGQTLYEIKFGSPARIHQNGATSTRTLETLGRS